MLINPQEYEKIMLVLRMSAHGHLKDHDEITVDVLFLDCCMEYGIDFKLKL